MHLTCQSYLNVSTTSLKRVLGVREAYLSVYQVFKKRMVAYAWRLFNVDGMYATKEISFRNVFETRPGRILEVLLWGVFLQTHPHTF